ncbi:FtsX-like permease family protein [Microbacterium enclense]|uniref:ABC transporter permease n=1 Tax=Microbacterium enclense TaxID=993073 RepID=UPI003D707B6F
MTAVAGPVPGVRRAPLPRERGMGASILVAAISSAFGTLLIATTGFIGAWLLSDPYLAGGETVTAVVAILSTLLIAVAMYVAAVVTTNTFATVVAGRTRQIALVRLIGASARSERRRVARQGLVVGIIGAVIGVISGTAAAALLLEGAQIAWSIDVDYLVVQPALLAPPVIVALATWASAWVGSRRVLDVSPLEAISGAVERNTREAASGRARRVAAATLFVGGTLVLAAGVAVGLMSPFGVVIAFLGGILSFTGLILGASMIMPLVLRTTGRLFGRSAEARLAAQNALRYPERSSRTAIGVVIGVTLVTMFAVAAQSARELLIRSGGGEPPQQLLSLMDTFAAIMTALVAVSAVIASVGLVNLLTLGVIQRRRELGLLRTLGFSKPQIRRMVSLEAVHLIVTSVTLGLLLGVLYGWAGAQALLGSVGVPPAFTSPTFVAPAVPWLTVAVVVASTAILTVAATVAPTRLATAAMPMQALADD